MTVSLRKAILGILITIIIVVVIVPTAYWFIIRAIDKAAGFSPILPQPIAAILAAASLFIAFFWITWAYSYLHFVGKGLPFEVFGYSLHPTKILVTTGPYAYVRNPMILGEMFILLGVAFLQRSVSGLFLIPVAAGLVSLYITLFEEKMLLKRFDGDYEEYRRNVPMLIPRLTPYMHELTNPQ